MSLRQKLQCNNCIVNIDFATCNSVPTPNVQLLKHVRRQANIPQENKTGRHSFANTSMIVRNGADSKH